MAIKHLVIPVPELFQMEFRCPACKNRYVFDAKPVGEGGRSTVELAKSCWTCGSDFLKDVKPIIDAYREFYKLAINSKIQFLVEMRRPEQNPVSP